MNRKPCELARRAFGLEIRPITLRAVLHSIERALAWWVWVITQTVLLSLYAAGIPLSGGYPTPVEATAPQGLAVAQLIVGTLLAPALLFDFRSLSSAACVGLVFQTLAGRLAGFSLMESAPLLATVAIWLAAAGSARHRPTVRLAFLFAMIGGPVLFYVRAEYRDASTSPHLWAWAWSPTVGICSNGPHQAPWRTLLLGLALLAIVFVSRRVTQRDPNGSSDALSGQ